MKAICIHTAKGGVGKSTTAASLAAALAEQGKRVLLLDLDSQASAAHLLGIDPRDGLLEVLASREGLLDRIEKGSTDGVGVIAGGGDLTSAERQLAGEVGGEQIVRLALASLPVAIWDMCIIDCPPGVNTLNVGALVAASMHIAPCEPSPLGLAGLTDSLQVAQDVRERMNPGLAPSKVLLSRVPRTRAARLTAEGLRAEMGTDLFSVMIPERAKVVEAAAAQVPVVTYDPHAPVSLAFKALAEEVRDMLGQ